MMTKISILFAALICWSVPSQAIQVYTVCPSGCNYPDPGTAEAALPTIFASTWPQITDTVVFEWTAGDNFNTTLGLPYVNNSQAYFACKETQGSDNLLCPQYYDPVSGVTITAGMPVSGPGIGAGVTVSSVSGSGPYTVALSSAPAPPSPSCTLSRGSQTCTQTLALHFGSAHWVVHRSSQCYTLPAGTRAGPSNTTTGTGVYSGMARLTSPINRGPAIMSSALGVSYHRFECLEIATNNTPGQEPFELVQLAYQLAGSPGFGEHQRSDLAHHVTFDRTYIHHYLDWNQADILLTTVIPDAAYLEVTNSTIMNFNPQEEAHALGGATLSGPFVFRNNEFESSQIGTIFGGGTSNITGAKATGVQFLGNYYYRPWSWRVTSGTVLPQNNFYPSTCLYDSNGGESYIDSMNGHWYNCVGGTWTDEGLVPASTSVWNSEGSTINKLQYQIPSSSMVQDASASQSCAGGTTYPCIPGIATSTVTSGNLVTITSYGVANCVFDGATTSGDYVSYSTTVGGDCTDVGAHPTTGNLIVGNVLSTNASAGTYSIFIFHTGIMGATPINVPFCGSAACTQTGAANNLVCTSTAGSATVNCNDTTGLQTGMVILGPPATENGGYSSVVTIPNSTSFTMSATALWSETASFQFATVTGVPYCTAGCSLDKNQFECKDCFGWVVDGNWIANAWQPGLLGQSGACILLNQVDVNSFPGPFNPDEVESYVTFSNNRCDSTSNGLGTGGGGGPQYNWVSRGLKMYNNLWTNMGLPQITGSSNIGAATAANLIYFSNPAPYPYQDIALDHNTFLLNNSVAGYLGAGSWYCGMGTPSFISWTNTIATAGQGVWFASGCPADYLGYGFNNFALFYQAPTSNFAGDLIITGQAPTYQPCYPYGNSGNCGQNQFSNNPCNGCQYPTSLSSVFQNYPTNLAVSSTYQGMGYLGTDPGADIQVVNWSTQGAASGAPNPYLDFRVRSLLVSGTTATYYYTAPDTGACTLSVANNGGYNSPAYSSSDSGGNPDRSVTVTGLSPNTRYWYKLVCGVSNYRRSDVFITTGP